MTSSTCASARAAIETRELKGWTGLPAGCSPDALFGVAFDEASWGMMPLGARHEPSRTRLLELGGYYRPLARVRDAKVIMFDAMNPSLATDWAALSQSLGNPDAVEDFMFAGVSMVRGEHIYAGRGITVFVNPENQRVVYVALYVPTTVDVYRKTLQPDLDKKRR